MEGHGPVLQHEETHCPVCDCVTLSFLCSEGTAVTQEGFARASLYSTDDAFTSSFLGKTQTYRK